MPILPPKNIPPVVLCFGSSDPTAGSGIQADILTLSACGVHPLSVLTAVTVQDTRALEVVWALGAEQIDEQARVLLEDFRIAAFKIGAIGTAINAAVLAEIVSDYPDIPLVLAPAIGGPNDEEDLPEALRDLLLPLTTVLCCNASDASRLAEDPELDEEQQLTPAACARRLLGLGARHVLITGGTSSAPQIVDTLYAQQGVLKTNAHERLPGSFLGAGSTLSAAIAGGLAQGLPLAEALDRAEEFTLQSLSSAFAPGMGRLLPQRRERA